MAAVSMACSLSHLTRASTFQGICGLKFNKKILTMKFLQLNSYCVHLQKVSPLKTSGVYIASSLHR